MDEMTAPGEDSHKHKSEDAAKYLAESFFGLNMNPTDVGGEVLFDDYDDTQSPIVADATSQLRASNHADTGGAFSAVDSGGSNLTSVPNRFEENLDDLIVFSDDEDDDDVVVDQDDDDDDDENFDFGDEDDEDFEDDEEDDEEDDDEEDEEEDDELDDAELDFENDIIVPAPQKAVPVARDSRTTRAPREVDSTNSQSRSGRASAESRDNLPPTAVHRGEQRDERPGSRDERPAARDERPASRNERPAARNERPAARDERPAARNERPAARDERPAARDERPAARDERPEARDERPAARNERPAPRSNRTQQSQSTDRAESRGSDRAPAGQGGDLSRKSPSADDEHWNELEGWVWDDAKKTPPAAAIRHVVADLDEEEEEVEEVVQGTPTETRDEDAVPRRRGRRRGGRGRGRGRREETESAAPAAEVSGTIGRTVDFDDDFSEIMFEEDQEDFVSVSAGSVKAQRSIQEEPPSPAARKSEPADADDQGEQPIDAESGAERPRRGRRGRGGEDSREPIREQERSALGGRRPARDEDNMEEEEDSVVDNVDLTDFGDIEDNDEQPRGRKGTRSKPTRTEPARSERSPSRGQGGGRGRGQEDRQPREPESGERSARQPSRDSRPPRDAQPARDSEPSRPAREPRPARDPNAEREPRPVSVSDEGESRRGPRPPLVAAEFQDIPTWEEAIGSLALRTPSEEHARRAETRGRRDGGRPPRRKN